MKSLYIVPETDALELYLDSGCLINNSLLGDDTKPDMGLEDITDPFNAPIY